MSRSVYTPGPWTENACEVQASDGSPICEMLSRPDDPGVRYPNSPEADANSRLICASPDLLNALQDVLDACEHWDDQDDPVLVAARIAVAKATGEPCVEPTNFNCCHAPKDLGHMFGCPNSEENIIGVDLQGGTK